MNVDILLGIEYDRVVLSDLIKQTQNEPILINSINKSKGDLLIISLTRITPFTRFFIWWFRKTVMVFLDEETKNLSRHKIDVLKRSIGTISFPLTTKEVTKALRIMSYKKVVNARKNK